MNMSNSRLTIPNDDNQVIWLADNGIAINTDNMTSL